MVCNVSFHHPASFPWHKLEGSILLFTQCWSEHSGCHSVLYVLSGVPLPIGRIFLCTKKFRQAVGPTQCPIQLGAGSSSHGVNWPGRAASHSHPFTAKVGSWGTSNSTLPVPSRRGHNFTFAFLAALSNVTNQEINTQRKRSCRVRSGNSTQQVN